MDTEIVKIDLNSEIKAQYFIDYWRDLTSQNSSIELELNHSILYNPKTLFNELIDEIERKNLSNKDNKDFFKNTINQFASLDLEAINFLKPTLKLIQKQINSKQDDYTYLSHLLKMAQLELQSFKLGIEAIRELATLLSDESEINQSKIKQLSNLIIFELSYKKYSKKTIVTIINNIFSTYQNISKDTLHTSYPHNIECSNYDRTSDEYKAYKKKLIEHIDNLTLKERILSLENYFSNEGEEYRFVFQIKGLKGDDVNINLGNIQIYNPKSLKLFNNPTESFNELFDYSGADNIFYCNGAVTINIIDTEYAKQEAIEMLEDILDVIALKYTNYKIPISINTSKYYIIDVNGDNKGSGSTNTWEVLRYQDTLEIKNNGYDFLYKYYQNNIYIENILEIDNKILKSIHWKRKAIESNDKNEKILWHWIALENIFERKNFNTPKIFFKVVSKLLAKKQMYDFAWKHFHKLDDMSDKMALLRHNRIELNLPVELKNKIGLGYEGTIHLKNFTDNLLDVMSHIDNNSLFYSQLEYLNSVFTKKNECIKLLELFESIIFEKLVYIYRVRNQIVHNAKAEKNPAIALYSDFITQISAISIMEFIHIRDTLNLKTNTEIINNIIYEYDKFKLDLNENGTGILL